MSIFSDADADAAVGPPGPVPSATLRLATLRRGAGGAPRCRHRPSRGIVRSRSIGGNMATNAGGATIKGVTGYDLNALIIGSGGTLGVVVEATLRR